MHPGNLSIKDYTYHLPEDRIAGHPLEKRDDSKLLIYNKGTITEDVYKNISDHIPSQSLLIFNNTKVIEARLLFQKPTGGMIEIFCLEPHPQYPGITTAMLQKEKVLWQCLIGGASKWKHGQVLEKKISLHDETLILTASFKEKLSGSFIVEFSWSPPGISFAEVLHHAGAVPLPPYIKRKAEASDNERYQTVYAKPEGSVAAPTAGLHFTGHIFKSLAEKNILHDFVTLHVGAGTFKPVKSETIGEHEMHAEHIDVSKSTIENIIRHIDNIVAVGTTSLRTIESLYWIGVKLRRKEQGTRNSLIASEEKQSNWQLAIGNSPVVIDLKQWECYELEQNIPARDALEALLKWMNENNMERLYGKTQIIIAPGYKFRIAKSLVTNFHQPQSTLLLLIAAFIGDNWKKVYDHALQNDFRFLSYGDGCLLWRE